MSQFSKLCRACLSAVDTFKYYLFEDVSPDVYFFCTSIEIMKEEILPKSICNTCYDLIQKFSEFKKTCLQSQKTLLNYYSVESENKKLDWLNKESSELDTKKDILDNYVDKYDSVAVKEEHFEGNYDDDFEPTELPSQVDVKVEINKSHKNVRIKTTKGRIKLKCELCSKSFVSKKKFEIHKLTHQKVKKLYKCTSCNKTFMSWSGLKRHHENWHVRSPLDSVQCRTCGKVVKSRETLRSHEKLHWERKNLFICNVCGRPCTTSGVLKAHLETHKDNRERQYTCEQCGKKFYTNKTLDAHVQKCHTGKRYICQICSFPFTDKYNLAKHLMNHDGKASIFKCEVCNKSFTLRSSYVEHQRTHSGERPYVCNYCPKSFICKKRLTEHHRTHTGEKPYKCTVCDHNFAQRGTLTRHMKIHDRIVPEGN